MRSRSTGGIRQVNVESEPEMRRCSAWPPPGRDRAHHIRVNPDVDAKTHAKIATGKSENKFGIPIAQGARGLCRGRRAAGTSRWSASTCISAAS
jgi:diaminopimelate decarboxylase